MITVKGRRLAFDGEDKELGIFLTDTRTGECRRLERCALNGNSRTTASVPRLGTSLYALTIRTRPGTGHIRQQGWGQTFLLQ